MLQTHRLRLLHQKYFVLLAKFLIMMQVKIHSTPNPAIIKLEADQFLVRGSYEYKNIDEAKNSPLAQQLFYLPFVKTIYISGNFIALERYSIVEWADVEQEVAQQVSTYLASGNPIVIEQETPKKQPITIYAESTPNPAVMKFVANKRLVDKIYEFRSIDEAKISPLATALFHFPYVKEVFMDNNYVSVMKYDIANWDEVLMEVREFVRDHIATGKEILSMQAQVTPQELPNLDIFSQKIVSILDEYVRPAVASDGGNIQFLSYDNHTKVVKVVLQGACSGCPSSKMTLKNGIENILRQLLEQPDILVEAVNE